MNLNEEGRGTLFADDLYSFFYSALLEKCRLDSVLRDRFSPFPALVLSVDKINRAPTIDDNATLLMTPHFQPHQKNFL